MLYTYAMYISRQYNVLAMLLQENKGSLFQVFPLVANSLWLHIFTKSIFFCFCTIVAMQ